MRKHHMGVDNDGDLYKVTSNLGVENIREMNLLKIMMRSRAFNGHRGTSLIS